MAYKKMRLRKYYDVIKSNNSFFKANFSQQLKIISNILKFMKTNSTKPLIISNKPVIAQIEPTSLCNLKCEMCIREKTGVPIGTMTFENFKKILDKLDSLFKIHLSGQGEPFLNPEIFKMIDYANKRGITVFFTTNATVLTKEVIEKMCEVEIGEIGISIDSTKKEVYEKIRRGANFEKVKNNVKNLAFEFKKRKKKTILSTTAVIMKSNIDEVEEFVLFANELGIKKVGFQTMQEKEDYITMYDSPVKKQTVSNFNSKLKEKIRKARVLADKYHISLIFDEEKSPGCVWPWRSIYITWNGYVTPCCKILNYNKPYFGNILNEDFWKIWNGKNYQEYRRLLKNRNAPANCVGCSMI